MFSWIKRRLLLEHRKLAWQNFRAAHDPETKLMAGFNGDWEARESYDGAQRFSRYFVAKLAAEEKLSADDVDGALKLNKGLRRLYDSNRRHGRGSFDQVYRPLMGWKSYFARTTNEFHLVEQQEKIEKDIEEFRSSGILPKL